MVDDTRARQNTNKEAALFLGDICGIPIFPASGDAKKTPLIKAFNKHDKDISAEEREGHCAKYREENDTTEDPVHVGATTNKATIHKIWRKFPNAVPAIACGPAGVVVLDADQKDDGPAKLRAHFEAHGGIPADTIIIKTQSGGEHLYFSDPTGTFTNRAGALKRDCGTDVRGKGGQTIAPGTWLEGGKRYGTRADLIALGRAIKGKSLPPLPEHVVAMIGQSAAPEGEDVSPNKERDVIRVLSEEDWPEPEALLDPVLGKYDLDSLRVSDPEFAALCDDPSGDTSTDRFKYVRHIMAEWPDMPVLDLAVLLEQWEPAGQHVTGKPSTGEYDNRQIAREWLKNQNQDKPSTGDAFGDVSSQIEQDERPKLDAGSKIQRADVIVANHKPMRWRVKGLIPAEGVGAMYSPPNVGKSFLGLDCAQHVRRGRAWFGQKTTQCDVLYFYGEGHAGISGRLKAWADHNDTSGGEIAIRDGVPNLFSDPRAVKTIVAECEAVAEQSGLALGMIVIDTYAKATSGADENYVKDTQIVLDRLRTLSRKLKCAVLVIHHSGKDAKNGMRGSSAILGDFDFTLRLDEGKGGKITMTPAKMRDAAKGKPFEFRLKVVDIGVDEDGETVTSCIIEHFHAAARPDLAVDPEGDGPETEDKLAPDLEAQKYAAMKARASKIAALVVKNGKGGSQGMVLSHQMLMKLMPEIETMWAESTPSNRARDFRNAVLGGESQILLPEGWLSFVPGSGKRPSNMVFKPGT